MHRFFRLFSVIASIPFLLNDLKEWIYYTKSEAEFFTALNAALGKLKPFPIEIDVAADPSWESYQAFALNVVK